MLDLLRLIADTPVPAILVVTGVAFLFVAIGGKLGAHIISENVRSPYAAILGTTLLGAGVALSVVSQLPSGPLEEPLPVASIPAVPIDKQLLPVALPPQPLQNQPPAVDNFNLRPPDEAGRKVRTTLAMEIDAGTAVLEFDGEALHGTARLRMKDVRQRDYVLPSMLKETVLESFSDALLILDDQQLQTEDVHPLEGETILIEKEHGVWKQTLVGTEPTEQQTLTLKREPYVDYNDVYPKGPVTVAQRWTMDDPIYLAKLIGPSLSVDGRVLLNLKEILTFRGELCAFIPWRLEIRAILLDDAGEKLHVEFSGDGETYRSLTRYIDVQSTGSGWFKFEGPFSDGNQKGRLSFNGSFTLSGVEELVEN